MFLPMRPPRGAWVNRWTFSPLPSNLQICQRPLTKTWFQQPLTIETENAVRGGRRVGLSLSMQSCLMILL